MRNAGLSSPVKIIIQMKQKSPLDSAWLDDLLCQAELLAPDDFISA